MILLNATQYYYSFYPSIIIHISMSLRIKGVNRRVVERNLIFLCLLTRFTLHTEYEEVKKIRKKSKEEGKIMVLSEKWKVNELNAYNISI